MSPGIFHSTTTSAIEFSLPPGSYNAQFYAYGPYVLSFNGYSFAVASKSYTLTVPFIEMFPVNVSAVGVPANMSLGISLSGNFRENYLNNNNGFGYFTSGSNVSALAVNGTYKVMFGETLPNGAKLLGNAGNVTVNGTGANLNVVFHKVSLTASGLPDNTSWGFHGQIYALNSYYPTGKLLPGIQRNITLYLPTGSTFLKPVARGYYNSGFYVNLSHSNASLVVTFHKEYRVIMDSNFQVLPPGSYWGINGLPYTFDGSPSCYTSVPDLAFYEPNGTYRNLSVWGGPPNNTIFSINGTDYYVSFTSSISSRNITVNGQEQTIYVFFNVTRIPVVDHEYIYGALSIAGIVGVAVAIAGTARYVRKGRKK